MRFISVLAVTTLLLSPVLATAQQKNGVELISVAEVEVMQKNEKNELVAKRVEAAKANVAPGDTVIFTITCVNNGDKPAADIVINNPVPEYMTYIDKSAEGAGSRIDFSIDQGKSYGQIAQLKVKTAAGKEKPATPADVTTVRWTLDKPLPTGAKKSVSYRAKVK